LFEFLFKYPRDVFAHSELLFTGQWPAPLLYLFTALALTAITYFLFRKRLSAPAIQLVLILLLQVSMLTVVVWVLMSPAIRTERLKDGENVVALVLDTSQSMAYGKERPRFDDALAGLTQSLSDELASSISIQRYEFAGNAQAVDSFELSHPQGSRSAFADSLGSVLREARFVPLAAVILASDGADTSGGLSTSELAELADFGVPVHTIGVGRENIPEDLELVEVVLPRKTVPGTTLTARATIRHDTVGTTRVKVYDGDELLASTAVELQPDTKITSVSIDINLTAAGHRHLQFTLDATDGERELRNNSRTRIVEVAEENYRILYFEGEPRWEYKFLRRAVAHDEDLRVVSLLRVSPNKFYRQGLETPDQLVDGFPDSRDELFAYDAVMIGSVEAASLSTEQQILIRDFIAERGGSLLMLAGPNGLGNGGWGQSELADALPSRLSPSSINSFFRKPVQVRLSAQGSTSDLLRFEDSVEANRASWSSLPAIADYQVTNELKPAAVALLHFVIDDNELLPLLIAQPYGRGHSYILATGGTWRWQMSLPLEDQRHEIFWRQLLRTLVTSAPRRESLTARGSAGATDIAIRAEFRDEAFRPVDDIDVSAIVSRNDGESWSVTLDPSAEEPGVYDTNIEPGESGTYYIEAIAARDGQPIHNVRTAIHHEADQAEHFNLRRNSALLRRLSEATNGQYFEFGDLDDLPELLRYSRTGITVEEIRPIWDAPAVLFLLILLKAGEWLLRRRWGTI
jgi:uncharacterized membrane protein